MRGSALVVLFVAIGTFGYITFQSLLQVEPAPKPLPEAESKEARDAAILEAFQPHELPHVEAELTDFFSRVQKATAEPFSLEAVELFHFAKLYQTSRATDQLPAPDMPVMDSPLLLKVSEATMDGLRAGWLGKNWQSTVIRQVQKLGDKQCVVIVRHQLQGQTIPAQWWLIRHKGIWQAYDFEDLRLGLRLSAQIAGLFQEPDQENAEEREAAIRGLAAAQTALQTGELAEAEAHLKGFNRRSLPFTLMPVYRLTEGGLALASNKPKEALQIADQLHALRPNMPGIHLLKATANLRLKNWLAAAISAKAYVDVLGPDPQLSLTWAIALRQLGDIPQARTVLEQALQEFPAVPELQDALAELNME
jgi:tetratricopeptide (TPR) repeat protein